MNMDFNDNQNMASNDFLSDFFFPPSSFHVIYVVKVLNVCLSGL